jgi:hypothetical protein
MTLIAAPWLFSSGKARDVDGDNKKGAKVDWKPPCFVHKDEGGKLEKSMRSAFWRESFSNVVSFSKIESSRARLSVTSFPSLAIDRLTARTKDKKEVYGSRPFTSLARAVTGFHWAWPKPTHLPKISIVTRYLPVVKHQLRIVRPGHQVLKIKCSLVILLSEYRFGHLSDLKEVAGITFGFGVFDPWWFTETFELRLKAPRELDRKRQVWDKCLMKADNHPIFLGESVRPYAL